MIDLQERINNSDSRIYTIDGVKYISVTSVFSLVRVRDYIDVWKEELISRFGERYYTEYMDEVADQGSVMHALIEHYLRNCHLKNEFMDYLKPLNEYEGMRPEWVKRFKNQCAYTSWKKFESWTKWFTESNTKAVVELETQVCSQKHRFAGRFDAVLTRDIGTGICDWKSSSTSATDKHKMQAAAYYYAYMEQTGEVLDFASVITCGMSTKKGWHETVLYPSAKKPEDTIEYWFLRYQKYLALAMSAVDDILSKENTIPRYISIIPLS